MIPVYKCGGSKTSCAKVTILPMRLAASSTTMRAMKPTLKQVQAVRCPTCGVRIVSRTSTGSRSPRLIGSDKSNSAKKAREVKPTSTILCCTSKNRNGVISSTCGPNIGSRSITTSVPTCYSFLLPSSPALHAVAFVHFGRFDALNSKRPNVFIADAPYLASVSGRRIRQWTVVLD